MDARAIANEVTKTTRCFCDLDNWEPERDTGHSCVCPIHKEAMRRYFAPFVTPRPEHRERGQAVSEQRCETCGMRPAATAALLEIAEILEAVDARCMAADGPVSRTQDEITDRELRRIYRLATGRKARSVRKTPRRASPCPQCTPRRA